MKRVRRLLQAKSLPQRVATIFGLSQSSSLQIGHDLQAKLEPVLRKQRKHQVEPIGSAGSKPRLQLIRDVSRGSDHGRNGAGVDETVGDLPNAQSLFREGLHPFEIRALTVIGRDV